MYYVRNHKCITDASPGDRARIAFSRNTRGRDASGPRRPSVAFCGLLRRRRPIIPVHWQLVYKYIIGVMLYLVECC